MTFPAQLRALVEQRLKPKNDEQDTRLLAIEGMIADRHVSKEADVLTNNATSIDWVVDEMATLDGGLYDIEVSYNWNGNSGSQDFIAYFDIDTDRIFEHQQEPKDTSGNGAGDLSGTGTNQQHGYTRILHDVQLSAGNHGIYLGFASSRAGQLVSIWNISIAIKRVSL